MAVTPLHDPSLTERAPCDGCHLAARCNVQLLACETFSMYLHNEPPARWLCAPRAPTRARYEALLGKAA
jgi:hypothetical protein